MADFIEEAREHCTAGIGISVASNDMAVSPTLSWFSAGDVLHA
jgi:hypothetical protein